MSRTAASHQSDIDPQTVTPRRLAYRRKELAAALGVSTVTLWRKRAALPPMVEILPGVRGWLASDVERMLETRRSAR